MKNILKKTMTWTPQVLILFVVMLIVAGCSTFSPILDPVMGLFSDKEELTEEVEVIEMQKVMVTETNEETGKVTITFVEKPVLDPNGNVVIKTVIQPVLDAKGKPIYRWSNGLLADGAENAANNSGVPFLGMGVSTVLAAFYAWKNAKEKKRRIGVQGELTTSEGVTAAMIGAIKEISESPDGEKLIKDGKNFVKNKIQSYAVAMGVDGHLDNYIAKITSTGSNATIGAKVS